MAEGLVVPEGVQETNDVPLHASADLANNVATNHDACASVSPTTSGLMKPNRTPRKLGEILKSLRGLKLDQVEGSESDFSSVEAESGNSDHADNDNSTHQSSTCTLTDMFSPLASSLSSAGLALSAQTEEVGDDGQSRESGEKLEQAAASTSERLQKGAAQLESEASKAAQDLTQIRDDSAVRELATEGKYVGGKSVIDAVTGIAQQGAQLGQEIADDTAAVLTRVADDLKVLATEALKDVQDLGSELAASAERSAEEVASAVEAAAETARTEVAEALGAVREAVEKAADEGRTTEADTAEQHTEGSEVTDEAQQRPEDAARSVDEETAAEVVAFVADAALRAADQKLRDTEDTGSEEEESTKQAVQLETDEGEVSAVADAAHDAGSEIKRTASDATPPVEQVAEKAEQVAEKAEQIAEKAEQAVREKLPKKSLCGEDVERICTEPAPNSSVKPAVSETEASTDDADTNTGRGTAADESAPAKVDTGSDTKAAAHQNEGDGREPAVAENIGDTQEGEAQVVDNVEGEEVTDAPGHARNENPPDQSEEQQPESPTAQPGGEQEIEPPQSGEAEQPEEGSDAKVDESKSSPTTEQPDTESGDSRPQPNVAESGIEVTEEATGGTPETPKTLDSFKSQSDSEEISGASAASQEPPAETFEGIPGKLLNEEDISSSVPARNVRNSLVDDVVLLEEPESPVAHDQHEAGSRAAQDLSDSFDGAQRQEVSDDAVVASAKLDNELKNGELAEGGHDRIGSTDGDDDFVASMRHQLYTGPEGLAVNQTQPSITEEKDNNGLDPLSCKSAEEPVVIPGYAHSLTEEFETVPVAATDPATIPTPVESGANSLDTGTAEESPTPEGSAELASLSRPLQTPPNQLTTSPNDDQSTDATSDDEKTESRADSDATAEAEDSFKVSLSRYSETNEKPTHVEGELEKESQPTAEETIDGEAVSKEGDEKLVLKTFSKEEQDSAISEKDVDSTKTEADEPMAQEEHQNAPSPSFADDFRQETIKSETETKDTTDGTPHELAECQQPNGDENEPNLDSDADAEVKVTSDLVAREKEQEEIFSSEEQQVSATVAVELETTESIFAQSAEEPSETLPSEHQQSESPEADFQAEDDGAAEETPNDKQAVEVKSEKDEKVEEVEEASQEIDTVEKASEEEKEAHTENEAAEAEAALESNEAVVEEEVVAVADAASEESEIETSSPAEPTVGTQEQNLERDAEEADEEATAESAEEESAQGAAEVGVKEALEAVAEETTAAPEAEVSEEAAHDGANLGEAEATAGELEKEPAAEEVREGEEESDAVTEEKAETEATVEQEIEDAKKVTTETAGQVASAEEEQAETILTEETSASALTEEDTQVTEKVDTIESTAETSATEKAEAEDNSEKKGAEPEKSEEKSDKKETDAIKSPKFKRKPRSPERKVKKTAAKTEESKVSTVVAKKSMDNKRPNSPKKSPAKKADDPKIVKSSLKPGSPMKIIKKRAVSSSVEKKEKKDLDIEKASKDMRISEKATIKKSASPFSSVKPRVDSHFKETKASFIRRELVLKLDPSRTTGESKSELNTPVYRPQSPNKKKRSKEAPEIGATRRKIIPSKRAKSAAPSAYRRFVQQTNSEVVCSITTKTKMKKSPSADLDTVENSKLDKSYKEVANKDNSDTHVGIPKSTSYNSDLANKVAVTSATAVNTTSTKRTKSPSKQVVRPPWTNYFT